MTRTGDSIWLNDTLVPSADTERLLTGCSIYADVATINYRPLYLTAQLACAASSYETLYGLRPACDVTAIRRRILHLQERNRLPRQGNTLRLFFLPPAVEERTLRQPDLLIVCAETTICHSYETMSLRPTALLVNYEVPFAGHRTSLSLAADRYMQEFARSKDFHLALHVNRANRLVSCGDYPVGVVREGRLTLPQLPAEAPKSVERRLLEQACSLADLPVETRDLPAEELAEADEVLVFGPHGLHAVLSCSEHYYYNLAARRLDRTLARLTAEGLKA